MLFASELVAKAGPDDIDCLLDVVDRSERRLGEIVVQIFGPQEHVFDKLVLKPCARDRTELVGGAHRKNRAS